jgi:hypothetical protein
MIKVYQIQLTDAEYLNAHDGVPTEKMKAYFDRMFDHTFKAEQFKFYTHVANVHNDDPYTDDMEEAFKLMNLWEDESKVEKLGEFCSSMSVGDILEVDGKFYRCASFGFDLIEVIC